MTSALLIANPSASQFTGGLHRTAMHLLSRRRDVRAIWPQSPEHSRAAASEAARAGIDLVIAMGGDGIVHHVGQGLVGSHTTLGIIPVGTTNVLARLLGVPSRPIAAIRSLATESHVVTSPTVRVEASGPTGSWTAHALFSLGIGPDAVVVSAAEIEPYRKYRFGAVHYARTAMGVVWSDLRRRRADVSIHTSTARTGIGAMVQFHPAYTYFGRIPLRLDAETPDPMSVLTIEKLPIRRSLLVLRKAALGSLGEVRGFHLDRRVSDFRVGAAEPVEVQMDGEHYGTISTLSACIESEGLRVAVLQPSPR